jgi:hypothetical protein
VDKIDILAQPWWVNFFILIPFIAYSGWRGKGLPHLSWRRLVVLAVFGIAFGFVEASVVVYLRAAVGLLPGYGGSLADVARLSSTIYQQTARQLPPSLLKVEILREAATLLMLISLALLSARSAREQWAVLLWSAAVWDLTYYLWLRETVRWPASLSDPDVLFLIPVPWLAQVWFPMLVSGLTLLAVIVATAKGSKTAFP